MSLPRVAIAGLLVMVLGLGIWSLMRPDDENEVIRRRLRSLTEDVNRSTVDGRDPAARARQLGSYFTEDVEVDLGQGSAPIAGRETVTGMAERLQPRTAAFTLRLEDVTVAMGPGAETADVHLTAAFIRRSITTGEESLDAREFAIGMRRTDGEWQIARVTAIDTLK
jgi:hypothetical protein